MTCYCASGHYRVLATSSDRITFKRALYNNNSFKTQSVCECAQPTTPSDEARVALFGSFRFEYPFLLRDFVAAEEKKALLPKLHSRKLGG